MSEKFWIKVMKFATDACTWKKKLSSDNNAFYNWNSYKSQIHTTEHCTTENLNTEGTIGHTLYVKFIGMQYGNQWYLGLIRHARLPLSCSLHPPSCVLLIVKPPLSFSSLIMLRPPIPPYLLHFECTANDLVCCCGRFIFFNSVLRLRFHCSSGETPRTYI